MASAAAQAQRPLLLAQPLALARGSDLLQAFVNQTHQHQVRRDLVLDAGPHFVGRNERQRLLAGIETGAEKQPAFLATGAVRPLRVRTGREVVLEIAFVNCLGLAGDLPRVHQLDEHVDFAGPDRSLGLLYLQAPGWPTSIGSRIKARQHLRRAVELAPQYPENRLTLIEACIRWGDRKGVQRELKAIEDRWTGARTNLVGEAWAAAWEDWEARLKRAQAAAAEEVPKAQSSPRQRE